MHKILLVIVIGVAIAGCATKPAEQPSSQPQQPTTNPSNVPMTTSHNEINSTLQHDGNDSWSGTVTLTAGSVAITDDVHPIQAWGNFSLVIKTKSGVVLSATEDVRDQSGKVVASISGAPPLTLHVELPAPGTYGIMVRGEALPSPALAVLWTYDAQASWS